MAVGVHHAHGTVAPGFMWPVFCTQTASVTDEEFRAFLERFRSRVVETDSALRSTVNALEVFLRRADHQGEMRRLRMERICGEGNEEKPRPS
jgi:hypothetical protein